MKFKNPCYHSRQEHWIRNKPEWAEGYEEYEPTPEWKVWLWAIGVTIIVMGVPFALCGYSEMVHNYTYYYLGSLVWFAILFVGFIIFIKLLE